MNHPQQRLQRHLYCKRQLYLSPPPKLHVMRATLNPTFQREVRRRTQGVLALSVVENMVWTYSWGCHRLPQHTATRPRWNGEGSDEEEEDSHTENDTPRCLPWNDAYDRQISWVAEPVLERIPVHDKSDNDEADDTDEPRGHPSAPQPSDDDESSLVSGVGGLISQSSSGSQHQTGFGHHHRDYPCTNASTASGTGMPKLVPIKNVKYVASYNWVNTENLTIVVPGSPAQWTVQAVPFTLQPDNGTSIIDQNGARSPEHPMLPLFTAADTIHGKEAPVDWPNVDMITDRNGLHCCTMPGFQLK
ncbi:hypothetical protein BGW80DRAFT_1549777 [Lactifluus volemus]|nr:hypothetical protein BGW80DRAFT_1549777 [Lactifluus volemus]